MKSSSSKILRAKESGNPIIEGDKVTFYWEGKTAPTLAGDFNDWDSSSTKFTRISPTLLPASAKPTWSCTVTLPRDAYVEYAFDDPISQKRFLDRLNRKSINNGVGGRNNYFYMPDASPALHTLRRKDMTPGMLTSHRVDTGLLRDDHERTIHLYHPPAADPVPLLIVYDGWDYLQRGKLAVIADNLIADGHIQPLAMAFLPNGGRWRSVEYICSDATLNWVEQIVLPLANEKLNLIDIKKHPGAYGVLGASAGGAMALYTGLRMPDIFGRVLSQSGVSVLDGRNLATVDLVKHKHAHEIRIWMDVGTLEYLIEDNRKMFALMKANGYNVTYREYTGGHNFTAWRDDVWRGLEILFPK
jgi:enterochelin esterase family protein